MNETAGKTVLSLDLACRRYADVGVCALRIAESSKEGLPPVRGFWSLTLYNEHHFFAPNDLKRCSLGTKNRALRRGADGSLTLYVQADSPGPDKQSNWLPAPKGDCSLYVRAYSPEQAITSGRWTPPPVVKAP